MENKWFVMSNLFKQHGVDEIQISTETEYVEPLVKFFKKRERMMHR